MGVHFFPLFFQLTPIILWSQKMKKPVRYVNDFFQYNASNTTFFYKISTLQVATQMNYVSA